MQEAGSTSMSTKITDKYEEEAKDPISGSLDTLESLDEKVVSRNSFVIIVGAYLRRHAVSPKNVNLKEF